MGTWEKRLEKIRRDTLRRVRARNAILNRLRAFTRGYILRRHLHNKFHQRGYEIGYPIELLFDKNTGKPKPKWELFPQVLRWQHGYRMFNMNPREFNRESTWSQNYTRTRDLVQAPRANMRRYTQEGVYRTGPEWTQQLVRSATRAFLNRNQTVPIEQDPAYQQSYRERPWTQTAIRRAEEMRRERALKTINNWKMKLVKKFRRKHAFRYQHDRLYRKQYNKRKRKFRKSTRYKQLMRARSVLTMVRNRQWNAPIQREIQIELARQRTRRLTPQQQIRAYRTNLRQARITRFMRRGNRGGYLPRGDLTAGPYIHNQFPYQPQWSIYSPYSQSNSTIAYSPSNNYELLDAAVNAAQAGALTPDSYI